jgi:hypothetical protein
MVRERDVYRRNVDHEVCLARHVASNRLQAMEAVLVFSSMPD